MSNIVILKPGPNRLTPSALTPGRRPLPTTVDRLQSPESVPLATLDKLNLVAIIVDARLRVVWASRPAQDQLGRILGTLAIRSTLRLGRTEATDRLSQAVRAAGGGQAADVVLQVGASDTPLLVRVLPFDDMSEDEALALLLVVDVGSSDRRDTSVIESRLTGLFALTPMEAKVACRLANGDGMNAVAKALGIAVSTARTHAARCYEKTGVRRQAALARLANRLRLI